jgi:hypothetical protein
MGEKIELPYLGVDSFSNMQVDTVKAKKNLAIQMLNSVPEDDGTFTFTALLEVAEAFMRLAIIDASYVEKAADHLMEAHKRLHRNSARLTGNQRAIAYARMSAAWSMLAAIDEGFTMAGAVKQMGLRLAFKMGDEEDGHIDMYKEGEW